MRRLAAPLLLALLAVAGCDDGPTDPQRTLTFSGTFTRANVTTPQSHEFALDGTSNVRIRLAQSTLEIPGSAAVNANLIIGLGRPSTTAGTTTCVPSSSILYTVGDIGSHGLRSGSYCLSMLTPATIPETPAGGTANYTVTVDITE
jgi:hypothetical protein